MSATQISGRLPVRFAFRAAGRTAIVQELALAACFLMLVAVAAGMGMVGAGSLARPMYILSGVGIAYVTRRMSPWLFLFAVYWFWLITPFVRRVVEWHSGFSTGDMILVTPALMSMFIAVDLMNAPGVFRRPGIGYALTLTVCALFGLFVSFFKGDVVPGLLSGVDWLIPLLYLYHFICHADRIDEVEPHLATFLTLSLLVVVPYSLYQYFEMPEWDAFWMINAGMGSVGNPLPEGSRVFGPTGSPAYLAIWCGTSVVLLSHFRNKTLMLLSPLLFFLVALTMVRAIYGSMSLAILVGIVFVGRARFGQLIAIILICGSLAGVSASALYPGTFDKIAARFTSVESLSSDDSAAARRGVIAQAPKLIADNPLGVGIGGQGRGKTAGNDASTGYNIDFGPLSVYIGLGWIAGTIYVLTMGLLIVRCLSVARHCRSPVGATMASAALVTAGCFPFINILGFGGVVLWTCLGYVLAINIHETGQARRLAANTRPSRRLLAQV
jgi:hypothetical protein